LSLQFGVDIGVRQCQRLFHQLGFRRRKPRPIIANADPVAQRKFKKTAASGA
jgi:transposase